MLAWPRCCRQACRATFLLVGSVQEQRATRAVAEGNLSVVRGRARRLRTHTSVGRRALVRINPPGANDRFGTVTLKGNPTV